ncbi:YutD family protein [Rubeoparvulum massiliense]|uniref:YutD family protein n=1 Tax=Rubeoparvulum massiliense TaxID=1631346 RepID=UPI00069D9AD7|nr:YutD family protein [Rubeoparvulum massiliense]
MIRLDNHAYELVEDFKDGWNVEAFRERYMDILDKFDFIVGDWGYGQLRLKGFYHDHRKNVPFDMKISFLDEYIKEFCNFGCSYFVLQRHQELEDGEHQPQQVDGNEDKEQRQDKPAGRKNSISNRRSRNHHRSRRRTSSNSSQKDVTVIPTKEIH